MKSAKSSRGKYAGLNILFIKDFGLFNQAGEEYISHIKREQRFLNSLIRRKYAHIYQDDMVILVYIHANFGKRTDADYKLAKIGSATYQKFMETDDYNVVAPINVARQLLLEVFNYQK